LNAEFRDVADGDVDGLVALWTDCGLTRPWNDPRSDIALARRSAEATILVATEANAIVGSVMVGHEGHRGWMYYLAVSPALRRTGLGRRLVKAAEDWICARGLAKMHLLIRPENQAVRAFYEALGYGEQPRVLMARWLDGRPLDG
jgi:hypothetical protein